MAQGALNDMNQMESAALLWEDQEMITPTQKNDDVMQACPSDMIFLHELGLTENEGGAPTCTNDLNPPLAEKDPSVRDLLYMLSDKSSFENGNFQQDAATERRLDEALSGKHFDLIQEYVTPKILTNCKTNALLKAFEVKKKLKDLPDSGGAERNELELLINSLDEFSAALIHPLKSDHDSRGIFRSCLGGIMEKAIDTEQKKFISHPVMYNLLESKWYGSFASIRKGSWTSSSYWKYIFLNVLAVFDLILFPFLLALFFIIRRIKIYARRKTEREVCFVLSLSKAVKEEVFSLIKRTISYTIHQYGCNSANYCAILCQGNGEHNACVSITFEEDCLSETETIERINGFIKSSSTSSQLYDDLCTARDAFKNSCVRIESKKALVVFVDDVTNVLGVCEQMREIKEMGVKVVTVGFGEKAKQSQLEEIMEENALHFEEFEFARTVGTAIIQGLEGKDIYELYMDYFTTPYFLYFRGTLSSVVLLGLLFIICLMPSTLTISELEWIILLFYLGRIVAEVDEVMVALKTGRKATRRRSRLLCSATHEESLYSKQNGDSSGQTVLLRKFTSHFSDRWNMLDLIMICIYVIAFILRIITWAISTSVSGNRSLAVAGYLYGFLALLLTLRTFGHVMEVARGMGTIQIAVFVILKDLRAIFWLFISTILGFSLAMTKIYVVEASYSSFSVSHKHLKCDASDSFACWWRIAEHLGWSLLGLSNRDFFSSDDSLSSTLGFLLFILFLVMGVILLINILIALLTNTYQQVQNNSLTEWSFKKAIAINTYSACHPVPVPFNLISMPLVGLSKLFQRCFFKRKFFEKPGVDVERRDAALDQLVMKLTRTYFATFGYSFPLTDEGRMDRLLHETDKNRQMANQIIRRLFQHQDYEQGTFNAKACAWQSLGIGIDNCLLTYEGPDSCCLCDASKAPSEYHGAQCLTPFTRETPRLEVLIQESGERRIVGMGVVHQGYNCHYMPGWIDGTVGYHADDGKIFEARCGDNLGREVADAMAYRGDLMACEVDFDGAKNGVIPIVFFKNSHVVGRTSMKYTSGRTELFPYVAMGYKGIRVLAKMCPLESSQAQSSAAVQHITRNPDVYEKLSALRDEMMAMENKRREEAKEFQETLLNEIAKLGSAIRREKSGKCV